jgi:NAD(P)-dependent dehydrogenase (short-subunit alcohol dehydrogenase family)
MRLEGKVALISGGARGIGAASARLFASEGASVVMGDVREELGKQVDAEINEAGGHALFVRLDVTKEADWRNAIEVAVQRFGKLDVLVNNAGIYRPIPIEQTTEEEWDEVMNVNGKGVFFGTKHAIPAMRQAGGGSIINFSSLSGMVAMGVVSAYGFSKGGVRVFTKHTAIQHAGDGIRANSIHPGPIDTQIGADYATPERRAATVARLPLGRIGTPEEVAYLALYLASDESSFMTGSELVLDGGIIAQGGMS